MIAVMAVGHDGAPLGRVGAVPEVFPAIEGRDCLRQRRILSVCAL
jgi:hypothetical protein